MSDTVAKAGSRRRRAAVGVGLAMLLGVATSSAAANTRSGHSAHTSASKKAVTIAFLEGTPSLTPFVVGGWGAIAAGKADGQTKVVANGPEVATPSNTTAFALNMAESSQPTGFAMDATFPATASVYPKLLKLAHNNVITWQNEPIDAASQTPPAGATTFVGPNFGQLGQLTAYAAIKQAHMSPKTTGTALIGQCVPGLPEQNQEDAAGAAVIHQLLPKVKVVIFGTTLAQSTDTADWISEISKTSHLVFAMGACSDDTQSLLVVKQRHIGGNFVASASSADTPQQFSAIKSGQFAAGVVQDTWSGGYIATNLLIDAARGKPFRKGWINSGLIIATKSNASQLSAGFQSQAAAQKVFLAPAKKIMSHLSANTKPMADLFKTPAL